jgi:hypothetical protein
MWCGEVQRRVIGLTASGQQVIPALRSTDLPAKSWLGLRPLAPSIHGQDEGVVEWYCRVPCCDRMTILARTLEKGCEPKICAIPRRKGPVVDIVDVVVGCCIVQRKTRLVQVGYCD